MLADAHRNAAEDIEASIAGLTTAPRAARIVIEGAWGATFQWVAFECQAKHARHQESHAPGNVSPKLGESAIADKWERIDQLRQGGWYGTRTDPLAVSAALSLMEEVRTWATS